MDIFDIRTATCGLYLFLFGMNVMGESPERTGSHRMAAFFDWHCGAAGEGEGKKNRPALPGGFALS